MSFSWNIVEVNLKKKSIMFQSRHDDTILSLIVGLTIQIGYIDENKKSASWDLQVWS